ncbi:MAG: hypothetical protein AB8F74_12205 [Saprospiraceae bacterium]
MQLNKQKIKNHIRQGEFKSAFQEFKNTDLPKSQKTAITLIESEYNMLLQETAKGLIGNEEKQLRLNRINNKLLTLLDEEAVAETIGTNKKIFPLVLGLGFLLALASYFFFTNQSNNSCPSFNKISTNKILLIPFENVGDGALAKPHLILRDRIEALSIKNNLSTNVELGESIKNLSISKAPEVAKKCGANVIIWGKYSNDDDSVRLILQYHFLDFPDWSKYDDLVVLKDVTGIQQGTMSKKLEDSIMSLCSVIAIRQGKKELTKKWLGEVEEKEALDLRLAKILDDK